MLQIMQSSYVHSSLPGTRVARLDQNNEDCSCSRGGSGERGWWKYRKHIEISSRWRLGDAF